jgi:hypothetical protein
VREKVSLALAADRRQLNVVHEVHPHSFVNADGEGAGGFWNECDHNQKT